MNQTFSGDKQGEIGTVGTLKNPLIGDSLNSLTGADFVATLVPKLIGLLFVFGSIAFFFMFLWGAVSYILSGGDKSHMEIARSKITNAFVGIVLLFGSFAIVKLVEAFFGVDILSIDIGPLVIQ